MDARTARTRSFISSKLKQWAGISVSDQCNFLNSVTNSAFSFKENINRERDNIQQSVTLANRYRLVAGMTFFTFCILHKRAWRRTFYVWAGSSWFICPEWPTAYLYPKIPLTELIEEERDEKELARLKAEIDA